MSLQVEACSHDCVVGFRLHFCEDFARKKLTI